MICGSRVINSLPDGLSVTYFIIVPSHYCALIVCSNAILQDISYHTHIHTYNQNSWQLPQRNKLPLVRQ